MTKKVETEEALRRNGGYRILNEPDIVPAWRTYIFERKDFQLQLVELRPRLDDKNQWYSVKVRLNGLPELLVNELIALDWNVWRDTSWECMRQVLDIVLTGDFESSTFMDWRNSDDGAALKAEVAALSKSQHRLNTYMLKHMIWRDIPVIPFVRCSRVHHPNDALKSLFSTVQKYADVEDGRYEMDLSRKYEATHVVLSGTCAEDLTMSVYWGKECVAVVDVVRRGRTSKVNNLVLSYAMEMLNAFLNEVSLGRNR